jgi:hypothetical protein
MKNEKLEPIPHDIAHLRELEVSWQLYQGKILIYIVNEGEFIVAQTPSLS